MNLRTLTKNLIPLAASLAGLTFQGHAADIAIINPSFEDPVLVSVDAVTENVPGWTLESIVAGSTGGAYLPASHRFDDPVPDGAQVGYAAGRALSQTTNTVVTAGTLYKLTVQVGARHARPVTEGDFGIELRAAGNVLARAETPVPMGTFVEQTVRFRAPVGHASVGQPLQIWLSGEDLTPGLVVAYFDSVRLVEGDVDPPVITLDGPAIQTVSVGSAYQEFGATANDDVDGDITASLSIDASAVDTLTVGVYQVTYDATDAAGNVATTVTRNVHVIAAPPSGTVPIINPNFEEPAVANDAVSDSVPGWVNENVLAGSAGGLWRPANGRFTDPVPEGLQVGYATGRALSQTTSTTVVEGFLYTLTAQVGAASGFPVTEGDFGIELRAGGAVLARTETPIPEQGAFVEQTVRFRASAGHPSIGQTLQIWLSGEDLTPGLVGAYFDSVVLTEEDCTNDTEPPVITLLGPDPQLIDKNNYVELGATAWDDCDTQVSDNITIDASQLDASTQGAYQVFYNVMDDSGNAAATVARTVVVGIEVVNGSFEAPSLSTPRTFSTTVDGWTVEGLSGLWFPDVDGSGTDDYSDPIPDGKQVGYASAGGWLSQVTSELLQANRTYELTVSVGSYRGGPLAEGQFGVELWANGLRLASSNSPTPVAETFTEVSVSYTALVGDGNLGAPLEIRLVGTATQQADYDNVRLWSSPATNTTPPVITLQGSDPVILEYNWIFCDPGSTAVDGEGNDISSSIVIDSSSVDTSVPGDYTVTYNVTNALSVPAVPVTRTVRVVDTTPPVVTPNGANPFYVAPNTAYSELGAQAYDALDGDLSASVSIDASAVDTSSEGAYSVMYMVTDANGNTGQATRTVIVGTPVAPACAVTTGFKGAVTSTVLTLFQGKAYFFGSSAEHGRELWVTDGTSIGTHMVTDILPGPDSSIPNPQFSSLYIVAATDSIYFWAADGVHGTEMWKSDGTEAGTMMVKDIWPGAVGSRVSVNPVGRPVAIGNTLFFSARGEIDGVDQRPKLWKTDGTEAGTVMLGAPDNDGSNPISLTAFDGKVFFGATSYNSSGRHLGTEPWVSDGTKEGTHLILDLSPGSCGLGACNGISTFTVTPAVEFNGELFLSNGTLYRTDGTEAGTMHFPGISSVDLLTVVGNELFFVGSDGTNGLELWKSDGTEAGTMMVKDINPSGDGIGGAVIAEVFGNEFYFIGNDGVHGDELWKSDGTEAGTMMIVDLNPGTGRGVAGATVGTDQYSGVVNNRLYFVGNNGASGEEWFVTNGTAEGTFLVSDGVPGSSSSVPSQPRDLNGDIIFMANSTVSLLDLDTEPPVVTLNCIEATVSVGNAYVPSVATAIDECDGDISNAVVFDTRALDVNVPGTYQVTYRASDSAGNTGLAQQTVFVTNTPPPLLSYEDWKTANFTAATPVAERDRIDDPDADDLSNGLEYLMGTDPEASTASPIDWETSSTELVFTFPRIRAVAPGTEEIKQSTDMSLWTTAIDISVMLRCLSDTQDLVTVRVPRPLTRGASFKWSLVKTNF